jgi:Fe2+ or Zn2+ uptake regulation protein
MDAIYAEVKRRAQNDPSILAVLAEKAELTVTVQRKVVQATQESLRGKVAILISESFFEEVTSANSAYNELVRRGASVAKPSVYKECDILTSMGF